MFDFGPLAAQNDRDVLTYFHKTRQALSLVDFRSEKHSFIFVARPGSGKSALLKWLNETTRERVSLVISAEKSRLPSDEATLNAGDIHVMIASELYTTVISEIEREGRIAVPLREEVTDFLSEGWKMIKRFFKEKLGGFSVFGFGLTLKPADRLSYLQEIRRTDRLTKARDLLEKITEKTSVLLIIDDPELIVGEGLDDVTPENARRVGSLLSVLAEVHSIGVRVIVFVREHILQNTRAKYDNFQHFADRIEGVEWTAPDLVRMLELRVTTRLKTKWKEVFEFNQDDLVKTIFPFLVNGPRDLLHLCNVAGRDPGRISMLRFEKGLRAHKADKWRDLSTYYGRQWPDIDQFARAMVEALKAKYSNKPIPVGAINQEFDSQFAMPRSSIHSMRKRIPWVDGAKWESQSVMEKLFVIGCLGYISEGEKFYPWAGRDLDRFRSADSHFISPIYAL